MFHTSFNPSRCKNGRDVHIKLSREQYDEHLDWFSYNFESIVGTESVTLLKFLAGHFEQMSPDRWFSSKACDEVGQQWICDCYGYNRLMNDTEPSERIQFIKKLIRHYNPRLADAVIHCYVFGLNDEESNDILKPFGVERKKEFVDSGVPNWRQVYHSQ